MTQRRIYQEEYPYFITFRTKEGWLLFEDEKMARLLADIIFNAGELKRYDILAFQIMLEHVHLLVNKYPDDCFGLTDRTLENVRSVGWGDHSTPPERTLSRVRSHDKILRSVKIKPYNISDLMQSIKGNFSRKIHIGNIWQPRFYTRIISTREYLETVIHYIQNNSVKAGLPEKYQQIPYQYFDWQKIHALF